MSAIRDNAAPIMLLFFPAAVVSQHFGPMVALFYIGAATYLIYRCGEWFSPKVEAFPDEMRLSLGDSILKLWKKKTPAPEVVVVPNLASIAYTDGQNIFVDREVFANLSPGERQALIAHEFHHVLSDDIVANNITYYGQLIIVGVCGVGAAIDVKWLWLCLPALLIMFASEWIVSNTQNGQLQKLLGWTYVASLYGGAFIAHQGGFFRFALLFAICGIVHFYRQYQAHQQEYDADKFAAKHVSPKSVESLLERVWASSKEFEASYSHPATNLRIFRLQEMDAQKKSLKTGNNI